MNAASLSPAQTMALATRIAAQRDYFDRLLRRMSELQFPTDDRLAIAVRHAGDAIEHLYHVAAAMDEVAQKRAEQVPSKREAKMMKRNGIE